MSNNNQRKNFRRDELGRRTDRVKTREKQKFEQLFNDGMDYAAIGRATTRSTRTVKKYIKPKPAEPITEPVQAEPKPAEPITEPVQDDLKQAMSDLEYAAAETFVRNELSNYLTWLKQKGSRSDTNHADDLAECAKLLVKMLRFYHETWAADCTIEDILCDRDDFEAIEFFNDKLTCGLLVHLVKSGDFKNLEDLHCWFDLEVGKINDAFLNLISLKAALRDFEGECEICRPKPDANRKVS
ncbi:MAG: hypothetical protein WCC72_10300 [Dehalococcoidales bacterium]